MSGSVVSGYIGTDGNVYVEFGGSTVEITSSAASIQTAISSGATNPAAAFLGNASTTRSGSQISGNVTVATFNGTSWVLSPTLAALASNPQVQVDNNFNVFAIWQYLYDDVNNLYQIQVARGVPTLSSDWDWSEIVNLTPATNNANATLPRIKVGGSCNAIAIWEYSEIHYEHSNSSCSICFQSELDKLYDIISNRNRAYNEYNSLNYDNAGNALAVWSIPVSNTETSTLSRIQGSYFNATTKQWEAIAPSRGGGITTFFSPEGQNADNASVALGANGQGIVSYTLADPATPLINQIYGNFVVPSAGNAGTPRGIIQRATLFLTL